MTVSIGAYTLCDGTLPGGVAVSDLRINQTRVTDVVPILGGISPQAYDRTGRPCQYAFTVKRTHPSLEDAEAFILHLEGAIPAAGAIDVITTGPASISFTIPNGKVQSHELIQHQGATTFHDYSVIGGSLPALSARPTTLNQVITTGAAVGLWPSVGVPVTPTTLTEVIDAGTTLGLWPSVGVPVTPGTLNEVIDAGTALDLWL